MIIENFPRLCRSFSILALAIDEAVISAMMQLRNVRLSYPLTFFMYEYEYKIFRTERERDAVKNRVVSKGFSFRSHATTSTMWLSQVILRGKPVTQKLWVTSIRLILNVDLCATRVHFPEA